MVWPRRIYVATTVLGVYYTEDFTDPAVQPTWTAINTGLAATDCKEFFLDPFDPADRQYVLLEANRILYRRDGGGNWAAILTPADCDTLLSTTQCTIGGFCTDPSIDGRLWAIVGSASSVDPPDGWWAIYSDDYGDSWTATTKAYSGIQTHDLGSIRAYGDNLYYSRSSGVGANSYVGISDDGGATWTYSARNLPGTIYPICLNSLTPTFIYTEAGVGLDLQKVTNAAVSTMLQDDLGPPRYDSMWFHPTDDQHQRLIRDSTVYVTGNAWTGISDGGVVSPTIVSFAPWSGDDIDQMLVGLTIAGANEHIVGTLYGEADVVATGIAGTNVGTPPYTDSIPETCGVLAEMGVWGVDAIGIVHTHAIAMPGYVGTARGTPMQGDRSAWDVLTYATRHASDILAAALLRHLPAPSAAGTYARDNGTNWVAQLGILLADLLGYARGYIIRGGAADWEAYDASGNRFALIGNGVDIESRLLIEADISDLVHLDPNAIHDNVVDEIHQIAEKAVVVDADEIVIEDSAAAWAKKRVSLTNLLADAGGGALLLFSQVADATVANTTDETSILGVGRGSKTLDADILEVGTVIVIVLHGHLSDTGTPTLDLKVKLGGVEVCSTGAVTLANTITEEGFALRVEITCRTTGAGGTVVAGGTFEYSAGNQHMLVKTGTSAADTTAALAVDVTADWSAADAANTITCQIATIELMKADDLAPVAPFELTAVEV